MPSAVTPSSVKLTYLSGNENFNIYSLIRPIKNTLTGPYRTVMGLWTLLNKLVLFPAEPTQAPTLQKVFEYGAYLCFLNPAYPFIKEIYIPESPFSSKTVKIPCLNFSLRLPKWPVGTYHAHTMPGINKTVLKPHRYIGFSGGPASYDAAFQLLKTAFPETKFERDDFLLTCGKAFTDKAHKQIAIALNSKKLDQIIQSEGQKLIERWQNYLEKNESFNLPVELRYFTSAVITQAIFGNSDHYKELSDAVYHMNSYLFNQAIGRVKAGDKELFDKVCGIFNAITNKFVCAENAHSLTLFKGADFTIAQMQGLCLLLYFAGQETSSFALAHLFADLALNQQKQQQITEAIRKAKSEGIRMSNIPELKTLINDALLKVPPINGLSRLLTDDAYLSIKLSDGKEIGKYLRKGDRLLVDFKGTTEQLLKNETNPTYNDASIFGNGANQCIGRGLAMKELFQLPEIILSRFILTTTENQFNYKSEVTNQAEPFMVKLAPRVVLKSDIERFNKWIQLIKV